MRFLLAALASVALFCLSLPANAQLSEGGRPVTFKFAALDKAAAAKILLTLNHDTYLAEDAIPDPEMKKPLRFGIAQYTDFTPANSGTWQTLANGNKLWLLRIKSPGAFSLSIGFANMNLPAGTRLFLYTPQHTCLLGAFTNAIPYTDQTLATEQLDGDEVIIAYEAGPDAESQTPFTIQRVSHAYRDINKILKGFGDSGNCQVNVNCPQGTPYQTIKHGVAAIISGGTDLCTGTLVNTTNNSGTPYFLTANHCYNNNAASWVFRFNWEAPTCANPATNPAFQSLSGATLKAKSAGSDFCLVQISSTPPASYNAIYAGWDKTGNIPTSTACLSHPAIDIMKIAIAPSPSSTATYSNAETWETGTWTTACTEGGSSGSALLDQNTRIVGQLFGGPSYCGAPTASMYDFYGKFSVSWIGGGTNSTRLSNWLDPNNTNPGTVDFYDPNTPTLPLDASLAGIQNPVSGSTICPATLTPQVTIKNSGLTTLTSLKVAYVLDASAPVIFSYTGSLASNMTVMISLAPFAATVGNHTFKAYTFSPNNGTDGNTANDTLSNITFTVVNPTAGALPLVQGFENAIFPPPSWLITNPDAGSDTWKRTTTASTGGTASALKDNFNGNDDGDLDYLSTPYLDLIAPGNYALTFKVAYARYSQQYSDGLRVEASGDCGGTWQAIYEKTGTDLATVADQTTQFTPTSSQWRLESVDLSSYAGNGTVRLRFVSISGFGNNIFIDDINVSQAGAAAFSVSTDTVCINSVVMISGNAPAGSTYSYNFAGGNPPSSTQQSPSVTFSTAGQSPDFAGGHHRRRHQQQQPGGLRGAAPGACGVAERRGAFCKQRLR